MAAHADAPRPAVVLLSGGLDSATVLAAARAAGHETHALSFRYGQRHGLELRYAARQARLQGAAAHEVVDLGGLARLVRPVTALVEGSPLQVPKDRDAETAEIPVTYVPARNTLFLAYALAWSEVLGARDLWIGVNAVDYSGYPDCRPEFVAAFEALANLATKAGVEAPADQRIVLHAPLIELEKHEIIAFGREHGVRYEETLSCYDPVERGGEGLACGRCDSCRLRARGFERAGVADPTRYA